MPTKTEICNISLAHLSCNKFIEKIEESSVEANILIKMYDHILRLVLRDFSWPFATRTASLGNSTTLRDASTPYNYTAYPTASSMRAFGDTGDLEDAEEDTPEPPQGGKEWAFSYIYPDKCLKFLRVLSGYRVDVEETVVPFKNGISYASTTDSQMVSLLKHSIVSFTRTEQTLGVSIFLT